MSATATTINMPPAMQTGLTAPAVDAAGAPDGRPDVDDLRELMSAVNRTMCDLESTHDTLRQDVARLQAELAEANAQLRRSRSLAALGEMAAGIAHEIRNPLGSIRLDAQMLAEDLAGDAGHDRLCSNISRAVGTLDSIVRDVLSFARDNAVRPVLTTPRELLEHAMTHCVTCIADGDVAVDLDLPDRPEFAADVCLMTQAIGNVVRNAVEAMTETEGGERRLSVAVRSARVRCPDGSRATRVVIAIEDTGPGIPPEVIERMFNPFFTTRATGTGLGLAIVHRIVDAHGGHVVVRSGEDGGARVELCLPRGADGRTNGCQQGLEQEVGS